MSTELKLETMFGPDVVAALEERMREIARETKPTAPPSAEGYLSVPRAAEVSGYKAGTIRKWLCQKRLKNYGRPGSPRVLLREILNLEP
jgi:hypothetical protein